MKFVKSAVVFLLCTGFSAEALLTNPIKTSSSGNPILTDRAYVTRDIKTPDPIPEEGQLAALELMKTGRLYRYNVASAEKSVVSQCEKDIADYTGHKYCVALNSCGSALMLLLKTTGLKHGGKVLSNAFTFGAVPSAIEHAGGKAVYVESTMDMVMDTEDMEKKLKENPDCKHVLISHMRGKVADMNTIKALCDKYDAILLEDCAHSLGVRYDGKHSGHVGVACAVSSQSYKMINSGEGGFLLTDDADIAAQTAVYAGAYEGLSAKHLTVPDQAAFKDYPVTLPNYSIRMSSLAAAVIRPQIRTLDERIEKYNNRYYKLVAQLEKHVGDHMSIPKLTPEVDLMVHDSLQFNLDEKFTPEMIEEFLAECSAHGLPVELFGHKSNARNFVNWGFAPATEPLPKTAAMLSRACDVRMPLMWDDEDFDDMANVLIESVQIVLANHNMM
ncbi:UDP-4-amino-4-deoxy-L-arabinose-oxoglutarate aminotransferase [Fistulifera solaris]|uniref:UDP-4-amino-4-deoxy-L-arabinose-oxoglutarate aminotransferase n=1 Tax=Fistulifera solaris TaxID=1519565 RepID=A0A1Z5K1U4_FISSO|nr:UDP-4-amino-4-deoxy-L-arabinose-oxoglutarate aminotransferase [Fistulifera solaris]|eukprot:GAX19988.1 UDP-4-amino-4-deoxy-L-arabinose-oxoglutarate aminotransferase [Fistulifera solaris]